MSWITTDVRCADGHYEISVIYKRDEGPSPCHCGKPREMFYATREMAGLEELQYADPAVGTFRPVKFGGDTYHDKESFDRAIDGYCERHKTDRANINIEPTPSRGARSTFRDELRHTAIQERRKSGFDEQGYKRYVAEQRERHGR